MPQWHYLNKFVKHKGPCPPPHPVGIKNHSIPQTTHAPVVVVAVVVVIVVVVVAVVVV